MGKYIYSSAGDGLYRGTMGLSVLIKMGAILSLPWDAGRRLWVKAWSRVSGVYMPPVSLEFS